MPDSQSLTSKKYAVVTFIKEDSVEVVPSIWLVSKTEIKWPNISSHSLLAKFIKDCTAPSSNWILQQIKINGFSNSFAKAKHKAAEALHTSHLSSDSSENGSPNKSRKRKKPARYQSFESSGSESESVISSKRFYIPSLPKNDELVGNTSKRISNSQVLTSKDQNVLQKDDLPPTALYSRLFQSLEKLHKKVGDLSTKVDQLNSKMDKMSSTSMDPVLDHYLPDDVNLPVKSVEELEQLNNKLKNEKEFSAILVCFLHNAGHGKSHRSFILSLTKKVLAQEVAVQFSRLGRKGKKSFINYSETLNVILAAASLKFKDIDREELAEMFGKSLAGASDWNKGRIRVSDSSPFTFTED